MYFTKISKSITIFYSLTLFDSRNIHIINNINLKKA